MFALGEWFAAVYFSLLALVVCAGVLLLAAAVGVEVWIRVFRARGGRHVNR